MDQIFKHTSQKLDGITPLNVHPCWQLSSQDKMTTVTRQCVWQFFANHFNLVLLFKWADLVNPYLLHNQHLSQISISSKIKAFSFQHFEIPQLCLYVRKYSKSGLCLDQSNYKYFNYKINCLSLTVYNDQMFIKIIIRKLMMALILTWKYCTAELSSVLSVKTDSLLVPVQSLITRLR